MSFKIAAFIAAILAGLIPSNVEAIKLDVPNNSSSIETVFSNQELNSLEKNDRQVILAKNNDNQITPPTNREPSNFTTPGGRPSQPVTGINPNSYRTPPKMIDQGLGAANNPAGAGGGGENAEFDDYCPASKKE